MSLNNKIQILKEGLGNKFNVRVDEFMCEIVISYKCEITQTIFSQTIKISRFMYENIDNYYINSIKNHTKNRILDHIEKQIKENMN